MVMVLSEADGDLVTAAVTRAERATDGEIVTIITDRSDAYHDVGLHWAILMTFLVLALIAAVPEHAEGVIAAFTGGWSHDYTTREYLTILLVVLTATFLLARLLFAWLPLRMMLTPGATKARRVRRRAVALFKASAEKRTAARTGILLYLSLAERRAEIVADAALHGKVAPETWGEAMAALIDAVRDGRPGAGMAAAVERIGVVLTEHFPKTDADTNELPDRLIIL